MKSTVLIGSPRGIKSNSEVISKWVIDAMLKDPEYEINKVYLRDLKEHENIINQLESQDMLIFVFPLYTDAMPGIVMRFIEKLEPLKAKLTGIKIGFIIHSGFMEACHSRYLERYLIRLSKELDADYMGTAITGNSEGYKLMPDMMTKKQRLRFASLAEAMQKTFKFDTVILKKIAKPERLSKATIFFMKLVSKTGILDSYWNGQLKENDAYKNRFAKPYKV